MWWLMCGVVCVESMAAPLTIAMYNWSPEDAVLYNGILQTASCFCSFSTNFSLASTGLKKCDHRILLICGLVLFELYFVFHLPLPFYPGPLDRKLKVLNEASNVTSIVVSGQCDFIWCDYTPRVPFFLYLFMNSVIIGFGFPLISSSSSTMLSQILGPRRQGTVQGLFAFTGSFSQFVVSLFSTRLFEYTGYKYIMLYHLSIVTFAIIGVFILWKRLTPLKITPNHQIPTKYKSGTFYRL